MEKLKIEYPHLKHIRFEDNWKELQVPNELIELLKTLIPGYMTIVTKWERGTLAGSETEELRLKNDELRKKILAIDFIGRIVFRINNIPMIIQFYIDDELDRKTFDIYKSKVIDFEFEWDIDN
jgi:hypothetical protein